MNEFQLEHTLIDMFEKMKRSINATPLNLGGVVGSGGGIGYPPGGFVGVLPQTRVAYDLSELSIMDIPASGVSLLDNLNRIRYRINALEQTSSGSGVSGTINNVESVTISGMDITVGTQNPTVTSGLITNLGIEESNILSLGMKVYDDGVLRASDIQEIDFINATVTTLNKKATVQVVSSGGGGGDMFKSMYDSDDDGKIDISAGGTGAGTAQDAINALTNVAGATNEHVLTKDTSTGNAIWKQVAASGISSLALNDLTDVTLTSVVSGEILQYVNGDWINRTASEAGFTILGHTHTESEITDLQHDAIMLQGRNLANTLPTDGQAIVWDNAGSTWKPGTVVGSGGGATAFTDLTDVPASYVGHGGKVVRVATGEAGLEFATVSGIGDVMGPSVSVDGHAVLFDGATGKLIKDAGWPPSLNINNSYGITVGSGKDFSTITDAINFLKGKVLSVGTVSITVDPGSYSNIYLYDIISNLTHLKLQGDTRTLAGESFIHGSYVDTYGTLTITNSGNNVTISGSVSSPAFTEWVSGDKVLILDSTATYATEYTIDSASSNTITLTTAAPTMNSAGVSVTLAPNRIITSSVNTTVNVELDGFYIKSSAVNDATRLTLTNCVVTGTLNVLPAVGIFSGGTGSLNRSSIVKTFEDSGAIGLEVWSAECWTYKLYIIGYGESASKGAYIYDSFLDFFDGAISKCGTGILAEKSAVGWVEQNFWIFNCVTAYVARYNSILDLTTTASHMSGNTTDFVPAINEQISKDGGIIKGIPTVGYGYATLDINTKVVENPANATATPTAGKIPIADGSGTLNSWVTVSGSGASAFTELSDVPNSYSGQAGKYARINSGETGLEFATVSGSSGSTDILMVQVFS